LTFGKEQFGSAALGNQARTRRLVALANRLVAHPAGTLPEKLSRPADLRALYRLVNQPAVTHAAVLEGPCQLTHARMCQATDTVLILHDSTELNYTGLTSWHADLGQLGSGKNRGYLCHNSLAVVADTRAVLGLAHPILYCRPHVPKDESREHKRRRLNRESRLWTQASDAVGSAPDGRCWVEIADRGADVFEYLEHLHLRQRHDVVRAQHDRRIRVEQDGVVQRLALFAYARGLHAWEEQELEVPARPAAAGRPAQPARTARVRLAAAALQVLAPKQKRGDHGDAPLPVWVV